MAAAATAYATTQKFFLKVTPDILEKVAITAGLGGQTVLYAYLGVLAISMIVAVVKSLIESKKFCDAANVFGKSVHDLWLATLARLGFSASAKNGAFLPRRTTTTTG